LHETEVRWVTAEPEKKTLEMAWPWSYTARVVELWTNGTLASSPRNSTLGRPNT